MRVQQGVLAHGPFLAHRTLDAGFQIKLFLLFLRLLGGFFTLFPLNLRFRASFALWLLNLLDRFFFCLGDRLFLHGLFGILWGFLFHRHRNRFDPGHFFLTLGKNFHPVPRRASVTTKLIPQPSPRMSTVSPSAVAQLKRSLSRVPLGISQNRLARAIWT